MSVIFSDTGCDILQEFIKKYDIKIISYPFSVDGKEYLHQDDIDLNEFYKMLKTEKEIKTASLNPFAYQEIFEPYLKKGENIIYVHFSGELTGTFNQCIKAVEELKKLYPKQKIDLIDTKNISAGSGLLAVEIAKRNKTGMPHNELVNWANQNKNQFSTFFFVDDLKFLKRGGRISATTAIVGSMLQIKPLLHCENSGKLKLLGKAIGKKKALSQLVSYTKLYANNIKDYPIIILHSGDSESAEQLKTMLLETIGPNIKIFIGLVGTTVTTHCGPGTVAVFFHGPQLIFD